MISKLIGWFDDWASREQPKKLPSLEWGPLVDELKPIIDDHSLFLETRCDGFIPLSAIQPGDTSEDIVAIAVTLTRANMEPWDSKEPAKAMAQKLSIHFGRPMPHLLSRQYKAFVGYYVQVTA